MIYGENQVRQFYVVANAIKTATPETPGDAIPVVSPDPTLGVGPAKKFYYKYMDPLGNIITTDKIDLGCIRDVRMSLPKGYDVRKWTIQLDSNITLADTVGENYMLYFDFENINGFGRNDRYQKFVVLHANSQNTASAAAFYAALTEQLEKLIKHDKLFGSVFEQVVNNSTNIELIEAEPKVSDMDLLLGYYSNKVDVTITAGPITDVNFVEYDPWVDPSTYNQHTNSGTTYGGIEPTVDHTIPNRYVVFEMENFFSRGRADLYGLNGCACTANPSAMMTHTFPQNTNFVIVDIKYYLQEMGMLNQNSEKGMTFAIPMGTNTPTTAQNIEAIIKDIVEPADENTPLSTEISTALTKWNTSTDDHDDYVFQVK